MGKGRLLGTIKVSSRTTLVFIVVLLLSCCNSPLCVRGLEDESVKHYLLSCPCFAAQRNKLLTSAAQVCGQSWLVSGDNEKVQCMLTGSTKLSYKENCLPFGIVQRYILDTCRFS